MNWDSCIHNHSESIQLRHFKAICTQTKAPVYKIWTNKMYGEIFNTVFMYFIKFLKYRSAVSLNNLILLILECGLSIIFVRWELKFICDVNECLLLRDKKGKWVTKFNQIEENGPRKFLKAGAEGYRNKYRKTVQMRLQIIKKI